MNKQEKIKQYNEKNKGYCITNIKKLSNENIESYKKYGAKSLLDLYKNPSINKMESYNDILATYKPVILAVQGNSNTYSVLLKAENSDILHITKDNNYLVEIV